MGNTFCEGFLMSGSRTDLLVCIQSLNREAEIVHEERGYELAGIAMSNVDLTKSVKDLESSIRDFKQKTGRIDPADIKLLFEVTDNLRGRNKELEAAVESQAELLVELQLAQRDLQKQIETMRAELAKKPRTAVKKTQERKGP
jgi:hypothetical protein